MGYTQIGVSFTDDYTPLLEEINIIAKEANVTRSAVIRTILCDALHFTPNNPMLRTGYR